MDRIISFKPELAGVRRYLEKAKVAREPAEDDVLASANNLLTSLRQALIDNPTTEDVERMLQYRVPAMTPDGCTRLDGSLDPTPYNLGRTLGIERQTALDSEAFKRLYVIDWLVALVSEDLGINWLGVYQARNLSAKSRALVKLAYRGIESRAEFPLTEEFAKQSNNSAVGLTGRSIVINDIEKYLSAQGGPYYQCDMLVHSEACLPIFAKDFSSVIGIVDAESYDRNKFSRTIMTQLAAMSYILSEMIEDL